MSILRKALTDITVADLEQLVAEEARETEELEFKGTLPFRTDKNAPGQVDRWFEKRDRIGEYARDQLLAELVAFANAGGGTLILGLHETKEEPRRAERLEALPDCEVLAQRIIDACDGAIEPRLPVVRGRGVAVDETGAGFVLLRVETSAIAPHRLNTTGQFYKRRGEKAEKMTVREITDMTLQLARSGDRVDAVFREREEAGRQLFLQRQARARADHEAAIVIRVTAFPTTPFHIPQLTRRPQLWWRHGAYRAMVGGQPSDEVFPAGNFDARPDVRLRQFRHVGRMEYHAVDRVLRDDGLIEFTLLHSLRRGEGPWAGDYQPVPLVWPLQLCVGALAQIERIRVASGREATEFGLTGSIETPGGSRLDFKQGAWVGGGTVDTPFISLPRYSVGSRDMFPAVINEIGLDLRNVWGIKEGIKYELDWDDLLNGAEV